MITLLLRLPDSDEPISMYTYIYLYIYIYIYLSIFFIYARTHESEIMGLARGIGEVRSPSHAHKEMVNILRKEQRDEDKKLDWCKVHRGIFGPKLARQS